MKTAIYLYKILMAVITVFILSLPIIITSAQASNIIFAQSFFEDPSSTLTFDDVREKSFSPYSGLFNKGYSQSTFWLKFDIDPGMTDGGRLGRSEPFVLRLLPAFLDEIELYDPAQPNMGRRLTGNKYSGRGDEYHTNNFNFVLGVIEHPHTIWLRVKTVSTTIVMADAITFQEAAQIDLTQNFFFGIYFGIIILSFLITFYIFYLNRDLTVFIFSIKQVSQLVWALFNIGYIRYFFDELPFGLLISEFRHYPDKLTVLLSMLFDFIFLKNFGSPRWGQWLQKLLMALMFVVFLCIWFGYTQLGLKLNIFLIWAFSSLSVVISIVLPPNGSKDIILTGNVPKNMLILIYSIVASTVLIAVLPYLGLTSAVSLSLNTLIYHGLISAVAIAALLGYRARSQLIQQFELANALQISKSIAEEERANRQEQSRFLSMLSHELKTPLAGIRMVLGLRDARDKNDELIEKAIDDIDNVIRICLEVDRVDDGAIQLHKIAYRLDDAYLCDLVPEQQKNRLIINMASVSDVVTDPRYASIIIGNLLANALKYSPEGSDIEIRAWKDTDTSGHRIALSVANLPNHGDWPDPDKIFKKYYRSTHSHRKTGSGLGLYLVAQLCKILDCEVRYMPEKDMVRFVVWFPV